jgi:NADP-dependent 3-hydroxy acid dehydrogenase YdfG
MNDMKTIFLTGASRGLGHAIGEVALAAGHRVALTARNPESVADLVGKYPQSAEALTLDVTDPMAAERAMAAAVERFGVPELVITNAGYADIVSIRTRTSLPCVRWWRRTCGVSCTS